MSEEEFSKRMMRRWRPMLACNVPDDLNTIEYPVLASYKMDGVRALVHGGVVYSRTWKPLPNPYVQTMFGELEGFDGEIVVGQPTDRGVFRNTTSLVMSKTKFTSLVMSKTKFPGGGVAFHAFDLWDEPFLGFENRLDILHRRLEALSDRPVRHCTEIVPQRLVEDADGLAAFEEEVLSLGYEGVMVRGVFSNYKRGRSTVREGALMKMKRFADGEAVVTGLNPLVTIAGDVLTDVLGSLDVTDVKSGVAFSIGSGFTMRERKEFMRPSSVGLVARYRHFPVGLAEGAAPRFPTFAGWRDTIDFD